MTPVQTHTGALTRPARHPLGSALGKQSSYCPSPLTRCTHPENPMPHLRRWYALILLPMLLVGSAARPAPAPGAKLTILLPLGRSAYQTNEWIDVSVLREAKDALQKGNLVLTLNGADGS